MKEAEMECGIGSCKPRALQKFTTVTSFVGVFTLSSLLTTTCSTYLTSQITTLERYFGFSSSQSGFLMSCNDIGFLFLTLFVGHRAKQLHIPRVLSIFTILFGFSAIICSLPYFLSFGDQSPPEEYYNDGNLQNGSVKFDPMALILKMHAGQLCTGNGSNNCTIDVPDVVKEIKVGTPTSFTTAALAILAVGLITQGIGKAPRTPLLTCYIDDNGDKTKTAMYVGILTGFGILGPAIAFGLGGVFARMYVNLQKVDITPQDPRWVGAWWLGFLIFGAISIGSGIPVMFFPRRMKPKPVWIPQKQNSTPRLALLDFTRAIVKLLRNPVYMMIVIITTVDVLGVSGFVAFTPKYLETQFSIPAWKSNILFGMLGILSAGIGTCIGGCIVSKFKFSPMTCLKCLIISSAFFTICGCANFFAGCNNPTIVGYNARPSTLNNSTDEFSCYDACACDKNDYFPVCGSDGRNYFSPCFAGCKGRQGLAYTDCGCLGTNGTVTPGLCPSDCGWLPVFMTFNFLVGLAGTLGLMPAYIFTIRSVADHEKGLAVAFFSFANSVLGWLPGPVIFGRVVDTFCEVWSTTCTSKGSCAKYDIEEFRMTRATIEVLFGVFLVVSECVLFFIARKKTDWSTGPLTDDFDSTSPEVQKMVNSKFPETEIDLKLDNLNWLDKDDISQKPTIMRTFKGSIKK